MKKTLSKRILAMVLTLCLVLGMVPVFLPVEAEAVSGLDSLTCSGFISNSIPQRYIDTMMRYYINSNTNLQSTLNAGNSVVFMFEGGSDNYWNGSTYGGYLTTRNQAVVIVVQLDSSGNAYIPFYCENCSSIPDQPTQCTQGVGYSGSTTLMDGTYTFYTWNHTGPYGAFQVNVNYGYYTPSTLPNGQVLGAGGINIHTRSTNLAYSGSGVWSAGCQVIGTGADSTNEFNQFMKTVAGISYNVWIDYYNKVFNTVSYNINKGYYIVDRQLGMMDINGTEFGSGSLIQLYNSTALNNIAAASTTARNNAGFSLEYKNRCTKYASYCTLNVIADAVELRGQPCSGDTDPESTLIEYANSGDTLTAVGIYKNLYGNYWYEVITSSGGTGFVYAGDVEYVDDIITDIALADAVPPVGHVQGSTFYVNGTVKSSYNQLTSVSCYIYNGFSAEGDAVTGASDTPTGTSYVLKGSAVDNGTWMGPLELGNYTYVISASYANYYATGPQTLESNTGTMTLMDEYFAVIPSSVDQSTCSHTNTTYVLNETTCTSTGKSVTVCSTCGLITESVVNGSHSYGDWTTSVAPTCTETGTESRTCSLCGDVETQVLAAKGHSYSTKTYAATCQEYERIEYSCSTCGHTYSVFADELMTQWSETKPEGVDESLLETKTQYSYSDYETLTSYETSVDGYTQLSMEWQKSGSGTNNYVEEWPEGFDTTNSLYSQYNNAKLTASQTATAKTEINSDKLAGYIYFHWCRGAYTAGPINRTTSAAKDDTHIAFHAFYSTTDPSTLTAASDGSVTNANADCCTDSWWYYNIPVYTQSYTTYKALYTYERWTAYSDWSDTAVAATETRNVQTRTLYRYVDAELGAHTWVDSVCSVCGAVCEHSYSGGVCTICGAEEPISDFYLFGYINGANYGCEGDYANMGEYLFENGKLTVAFDTDSYVAVKSADNELWYMTDGWQGYDVTSAVLYDTNQLSSADKLYVPGGVEIVFTLTNNNDGTLTLSYEILPKELNPEITAKYPSLAFEDEVFLNVYFSTTDLEDTGLEDMGLLTWSAARTDGAIDNAENVIPGAVEDADSGLYRVHTQGIPAKKLGDSVYFKVYAKMADGTYIYSKLLNYSPKTYANSVLNGLGYSTEVKALVVAMLNYGAAAQTHFNYKPYNLVNSALTANQLALVEDYRATMVDGVVSVESSKVGSFVATGGFDKKYPSISFEGAFGINYYFTPTYTPDGEMTLYYWDQTAYNNATALSPFNATGTITMTLTDTGEFWAAVEGIAAKNLDDTVYVATGYNYNGTSYCSGILAYSIGAYCVSQAAGTTSMQPFAAATAVYGYYAKTYFATLE